MILTCPECAMRYLLAAHVLAPEGRRVKCSSCGHVWFQEPDSEEIINPEDVDMEDIPEAVKPLPEESVLPAQPKKEEAKEKTAGDPKVLKRMLGGYAAAAVLFFVLVGLTIAIGGLKVLGFKTVNPGEGLVFDRLMVKAKPAGAGENLTIEGRIINLTAEDKDVPLVEASLHDGQGGIIQQWLIEPPEHRIAGEANQSFSASFETEHGGVRDMNFRFVSR